MQALINLLSQCAQTIDMTCNAAKTVCMVFNPKCRRMIIAPEFPNFTICGAELEFVSEFKYLGHVIDHELSDDKDVKREIRNLFMRCNILIRRFSKCSTAVKLLLFKAYCLCLYDVGIWRNYPVIVFNKSRSSFNKCVKMLDI